MRRRPHPRDENGREGQTGGKPGTGKPGTGYELPKTQFEASPRFARCAAAGIFERGNEASPRLAYPGKVKQFTRRASLEGTRVVVRDDIEAPQPVEALWGMVTDAEVALDGRRAELAKAGRKLAPR